MELPFQNFWLPAVRARTVLFANHVLGRCAPATERLRAHVGKVLKVEVLGTGAAGGGESGWSALPLPPPLVLRITPAGLLETLPAEEEAQAQAGADLQLRLDVSSPRLIAERAMAGALPPAQIEGDAALAGEVNWILQNVRWDMVADVEAVFGPLAAQGVSRAAAQFAQAAEATKAAMNRVLDMMQPGKPH